MKNRIALISSSWLFTPQAFPAVLREALAHKAETRFEQNGRFFLDGLDPSGLKEHPKKSNPFSVLPTKVFCGCFFKPSFCNSVFTKRIAFFSF